MCVRKCVAALTVVVVNLASFALDNVEVTDVKARQRYPWNGKVDIDFTLDSKPTEPYQMQVEVYDNVGKTNLPVKSVCTEGVSSEANPCMVRTDTRRIVWDAAKDLPNGFNCTNVLVSCRDARLLPVDKLYCVIDLDTGAKEYLSGIPAGGWTDEHKTSKMVFRRIEAGTFMMGSPANEEGRQSNESYHQVTITKPYYIAIYELTEAQYCKICGGTDLRMTPKILQYGEVRGFDWQWNGQTAYLDRPIKTEYSWPSSSAIDSNSVVGRLRAKSGIQSIDLPTEAQWENAARASSVSAVNTGYASSSSVMNETGRYDGNTSDKRGDASCQFTTVVGCYMPNAYGIFDMLGNVREWCLDAWIEDLGSDAVCDPVGASDIVTESYNYKPGYSAYSDYSCRVVRGGGFYDWYASYRAYDPFRDLKNVSGAGLSDCRVGRRTYGRSCGDCTAVVRDYTREGVRLAFSAE